METHPDTPAITVVPYMGAEWRARRALQTLRALREASVAHNDFLTAREKGRLLFLRWLIQTGHLIP